jgi:hypothetical protein
MRAMSGEIKTLGFRGLQHVRFGGTHVDVAVSAGNEGIDDRREPQDQPTGSPGTGKKNDGPRWCPISSGAEEASASPAAVAVLT